MEGTIVIVDDEASVRELFEGALSERGHRVGTAGSVAEGLEVCERVNPDVVIVDIFMPERSGLELIRASVSVRGRRGSSPCPCGS